MTASVMLRSFCFAIFACGLPARALEIAASYQAGAAGSPVSSPALQGWTAGVPSSDTANFQSAAVAPDGVTGWNAWRMLDNSSAASQFITWNRTLTAAEHSAAAANGWKLAARVRLADPVAGNGGSNSTVLIYGNNAAKRWILFFDINAAGQIVTTITGGATVTLTGVDASQYHEHQLVFDPASGTAEYLVDGISKASGQSGTSGSLNGIQWGTGSTGGKGDGYWNQVSFVINDPPPPPLPSVTSAPGAQIAAAGGAVTLTAAFSGNPSSWQWYKDTVPVSGATGSALTISGLTPADAGDYWCTATNATGSTSTATAPLAVTAADGGLVISEFLAENDRGLRDSDGTQSDWIEIYNTSSAAQSTAGYFLTDDAAHPDKWPLPEETVAPGGFRLVRASGRNRGTPGGEWHASFALQNGGGYLALTGPGPGSAFYYPPQYADSSYGVTVHQPSREKYFAVPTPGALNRDGQTLVRDGLSLTPLPGPFSGTVSVSAGMDPALPGGGRLRFTTTGRMPEFSDPVMGPALELTATAHLRAAVIYPGERFGASGGGAYLKLGADAAAFTSPLPVMILSNHGAGAVPGVNARGPNGDGSGVAAVAMQAQSLTVLDAAAGDTVMTGEAVHRSRAGLKIRGSSSFTFAEKSYTMELWGEQDGREREAALLGLPAGSGWVLYGPDPAQFDNTLIHNTVTYELARRSGFPAPRFRFVELFLDSGGDLTMADHRGLAILVEKPARGKARVDFDYPGNDGTTGGWMISVDRMDATTAEAPVPKHFHTAGPDGTLQTPDDNARGYQGITTPGGTGSGSGITPANDDMPNYYHSFFNFVSPPADRLTADQRGVIQSSLRRFDAALYGGNYRDGVLGYRPLVDLSNWAHHLLLHCYTKNQDAVVLSSYLVQTEPGAPLRWASIWDFDRAFDRNVTSGSTPGAVLTWAHDRLYYRRMVTDPEFMQAYTDKWQELRRGVWSAAELAALVDRQAAEITGTVAARSGLSAASWTANLAVMKSWMLDRAAAMDAQFTAPPVFSHPGGSVAAGFTLGITAPAGTVYVTTDGTDPRLPGGGPSASAAVLSGPLAVTRPLAVRARVLLGTAWSGLTGASYFPPQDLTDLRVTEIHYHPQDQAEPPADGDGFEFLELKNTGTAGLDVSGLTLGGGIAFTFPAGARIEPGAFAVLVRNETAFVTRFPGRPVFGTYSGKLNNSGETLILSAGDAIVWSLTWDDAAPWRTEADGGGLSLQRPDPAAPGSDPATWTAAPPSPGSDLEAVDADADGLPDYWEELYGFQPGVPDGAGDADHDGATNAAEFLAGTSPLDAASRLRLETVPAPPGQSAFSFTAVAGKSYTVQSTADLDRWESLQDIPAGPATREEQVAVPVLPRRMFYRVVTPAVR